MLKRISYSVYCVVRKKYFITSVVLQETRLKTHFLNGCSVRSFTNFDSPSEKDNSKDVDLNSLLKTELSCTESEVENILRHPDFCKTKTDDIAETVAILKKANFSAKDVEHSPWVLTLPKTDLKHKIELLELVGINITTFLPLLKLSTDVLNDFTLKARCTLPNVSERINYLCQELQLEMKEVVEHVMNDPFVLVMDFYKFRKIIQLLKEAGVDNHEILSDIWVFKNTPEQIKCRIDRLSKSQLPFKTWVLRSATDLFETVIDKRDQKASIFEGRDQVGYLADRLGFSYEYVRWTMALKNARILTINAPKLKNMLDLLSVHGYKPTEISQCPAVFNRSIKTVEKRILEMKGFGLTHPYLKVICHAEASYQKSLQKLVLEEQNTTANKQMQSDPY